MTTGTWSRRRSPTDPVLTAAVVDPGVVVLGAGVTGLAAGLASGGTVLEAAPGPGGICSSYYVRPGSGTRLDRRPADGDAYRFEVGGGHWIFGGDAEVLDLVERLAPTRAHVRQAEVHLPSAGARVPCPIQAHVAEAAPHLLDPVATLADAPEGTMAAWLAERFDPALCARFFLPFHERYTAGLSTARSHPRTATSRPPEGRATTPTFRYPVEGLDTLSRGLADARRRAVRVPRGGDRRRAPVRGPGRRR